MKRGEIWTASGGADYAGKPRPVLILHDDSFDGTASITICLLATHPADAELARIAIAPSPANGLRETSYAMADKVTTIPRSRLGERMGRLAAPEMVVISRAIIVFLGLARQVRG